MPVQTGLDTGVFVLHASGHRRARQLWDEIIAGERNGVVSALTLFEIHRLGLRGTLTGDYAAEVLSNIPNVCEVVWLETVELLRTAARLSHGVGLSACDALILASALDRGCTEIYTVDGDLLEYRSNDVKVLNLART